MVSVYTEFRDCGTWRGDSFPKVFLLAKPEEVKGNFQKPKAVQNTVPGEYSKDSMTTLSIDF